MTEINPEPPALRRQPATTAAGERFYVTGGALAASSACYVPRQADNELFIALTAAEFCYVLTSRQRGKSSLMIRIAHRLRQAGHRVALLDLTRIGQNVTAEQWYLGLLDILAEALHLEAELEAHWNRRQTLGPMLRWFSALTQVALPAAPSPLAIFVDEIDVVGSLPFSTDEFIAGIRECYTRRTTDPALNHLSFCLLGVASAGDLMRDPRSTPFNVGHRIELADFTPEEARQLGAGLTPDPAEQTRLLSRVLHWTGGHPYLTQRLCRAVAGKVRPSTAEVDQACKELFFGADALKREDNLLFVAQQLLRRDLDRADLLGLYGQVRRGKKVRDTDTDRLVEALRLSGITSARNGCLTVRNRIYRRVFDRHWIAQNMPESEVRRQRKAYRKGIQGGGLAAGLAIVIILIASTWWQGRLASETCSRLGSGYDGLQSYSDSSVVKLESGPLALGMETQFCFERPNRLRVDSSLKFIFGELRVQVFSDGRILRVYIPALEQYIEEPAPPEFGTLMAHGAEIEPIFEVLRRALPAYVVLLSTNAVRAIHAGADNLKLQGADELQGQAVTQFDWEQNSSFRVPQGDGDFLQKPAGIPTGLWVRQPDGIFVKSAADLTALRALLDADKVQILKFSGTNMTAVAEHHDIHLNPPLSPAVFAFSPPQGTRKVVRFDFSEVFSVLLKPSVLEPSRPMFRP